MIKILGIFSVAIALVFSVEGFNNKDIQASNNDNSINAMQSNEQSFKVIDDENIIASGFTEGDYAFDPYDINDLMTKFNNPEDVDPLQVTLIEKGEGQVTSDGYVYTPYTVTVDQTYNPNSKFSVGQNITINVNGGEIPLSQYEPFVDKQQWKDKLENESSEWKEKNYYQEVAIAQKQSLDFGDKFFVILNDNIVDNNVEIGNGLMEINGEKLISNKDTKQEILNLNEVEEQINTIYKS